MTQLAWRLGRLSQLMVNCGARDFRNDQVNKTSWKLLALSRPTDAPTKCPRHTQKETMQSNSLKTDDVARLLGLVIAVADEERCSLSQAIQLIAGRNQPQPTSQVDRTALAHFMAQTRELRMKRNTVIGAPIFRDPGFDMLLELFAIDQRGLRISVTSLCYAAGVPMTTALRHLHQLERHGLLVREGDLHDNRRSYVRPTSKAITALEILFNQWLSAWVQLMDRTDRGSSELLPAQSDFDA